MQRRPIHRGGILSAGYDRDRRILEIEFDTHRVMQYQGVGREIAERFLSSASPLSHFRDEIEGEYTAVEAGSQSAKASAGGKKKKSIDELKRLFGE